MGPSRSLVRSVPWPGATGAPSGLACDRRKGFHAANWSILLAELLSGQGYEPYTEGTAVTLQNCPFHALTEEHRQLVCGMNLELMKGLLDAGGLPETAASLDPGPGRCCVSVRL